MRSDKERSGNLAVVVVRRREIENGRGEARQENLKSEYVVKDEDDIEKRGTEECKHLLRRKGSLSMPEEKKSTYTKRTIRRYEK